MEERERCYSFILSRTPHETDRYNINNTAIESETSMRLGIAIGFVLHVMYSQQLIRLYTWDFVTLLFQGY
jgi:hypothetical protein